MGQHSSGGGKFLAAMFYTTAFTLPWTGVRIAGVILGDLLLMTVVVALLLTRPPQMLLRRARTLDGRLKLAFYLLISGSLVGAFVSPPSSSEEALAAVVKLVLGGIGAFYIVWLWNPDRQERRNVGFVVVLGTLVSVASSALQVDAIAPRAQGLAHHPNAFALTIVCAVALTTPILFMPRRRLDTVLAALALPVLLYGLFATGSRAGLLAGSFALGAPTVASLVRMNSTSRIKAISVGLVTIFGIFLLVPSVSDYVARSPALERLSGGQGASDSSAVRRSLLDDEFDRMWASFPLGSGFRLTERAHNLVVEVAASAGVIGLVGLTTIGLTILKQVRKLKKRQGGISHMSDSMYSIETDWLLLALLAGSIVAVFNNELWIRVLWVLLGLTAISIADGILPPNPRKVMSATRVRT